MSNFPIFSVLGIEIEYMLVDKNSLNIQPKSDLILKELAGEQVNEIALGDIAISNELVLHVVEFKNNEPKPANAPITDHFQNTIKRIQPLLEQYNLSLMPTGAHPWMDPHTETVRWPHDNKAIYHQYDTIFDCKGHGWGNLQSMHVNLPYANDLEFAQLHNTIRLILPLLPALAASTPILDGKPTGLLDSRLHFYAQNQRQLPTISGDIIPEFIRTEQEYQRTILEPMYKEISPFDPLKILQHPWLNSRGAIPKFDQKAIEIRIIDTQECATADIAIAKAIFEILKSWHSASDDYLHNPCDTKSLKQLFDQTLRTGFSTPVDNLTLINQWRLPQKPMSVKKVWSLLIEQISSKLEQSHQRALEHILTHGNLSERILKTTHHKHDQHSLNQTYSQLTDCLLNNELFTPS